MINEKGYKLRDFTRTFGLALSNLRNVEGRSFVDGVDSATHFYRKSIYLGFQEVSYRMDHTIDGDNYVLSIKKEGSEIAAVKINRDYYPNEFKTFQNTMRDSFAAALNTTPAKIEDAYHQALIDELKVSVNISLDVK